MKSLWSDAEAATYQGALGLRVYTSRLLGRDKTLVLHGGGNTSVKLREKNLFGEDEDVLYVKGSGWDLETIEAAGFTPVTLSYTKFSEISDDIDDARVYGGIHFRFDQEAGVRLGREVATAIFKNNLQPIHGGR